MGGMKAKFTKFARSPTCGITQTRREGNALDHSELPFAFGSLCARLAVFHFRIKSNLNTDGRVHSPLAGSKRFCRFGYN